MKYLNKFIKPVLVGLMVMTLSSSISCAAQGGEGSAPAGPAGSPGTEDLAAQVDSVTQIFDTSFAVEFSYSCLGGGCHEVDQKLVEEYAASKMTHTMVKCNACHGTHTADTVGLEKPNLTGYYLGIGATGYQVDTDRCKACHNNEHSGHGKKSGDDCYSCHAPHVFGVGDG